MLKFNDYGIYCPQADIYIDPWKPVDKAIITHAHSDHAHSGSKKYLCHIDTVPLLQLRLGSEIAVEGVAYNQPLYLNGVKISFHPAGHIIGSAQIRLEYKGEIWVVSGDYKLQQDGVSVPFEPVRCHHFVTESTFGLPVYKFPSPDIVHAAINLWWQENVENNLNTVVIGYALGKAQRIIQHLDENIGRIFTHGAVDNINIVLRQNGLQQKETIRVTAEMNKKDFKGDIIVAPPSAIGSAWLNRFAPYSIGICSGWMQLRGIRRRRSVDRGFVLSDHCDWPQLNKAVKLTCAEKIYVMHGYKSVFAKWLRESNGLQAYEIDTFYEDVEEQMEHESEE